jgi:hypothetical protein
VSIQERARHALYEKLTGALERSSEIRCDSQARFTATLAERPLTLDNGGNCCHRHTIGHSRDNYRPPCTVRRLPDTDRPTSREVGRFRVL